MTNTVLIGLLARFIQTKQPDNSTIRELPQAVCSNSRQLTDGLSLNDFLRRRHECRDFGRIRLPASHKRIAAAANRRHRDERSADIRNHQSARHQRRKTPGIANSVSVTNAALIRLIARFIQIKQPGNSIIERVPQALRRCLRQLVDKLSLNDLLLKANSGKEAVPKPVPAAQTYMNTSLRDLAAHSITSEAKSKTAKPATSCIKNCQARKSQAWLFSF